MELRHLRYFVAVAEELSFTKGAEKLRIAQPSLTRQIKDLEEEIGARLLDRSKKRVKLTREGECLLAGAKRLLGYSTEVIRSVRDVGKQSGSIRIGYVPNPFHRMLPASITAFEQQFPTTSVNLFGMPPKDLLQALTEDKIDIAFVGLSGLNSAGAFEFRVIASYPGIALLPRNNQLVSKNSVKLKDLESMFFISVSDSVYPGYSRWLNSACEEAGFKPKVLETVESDSLLIQAIRNQLGVAVLPEQIRDVPHENITIRDITPAVLMDSAVGWKKNNPSEALKAYLAILEDLGRQMT